ncbi:MAG: hypothetical protein ACLFVH_06470 [Phycisphaerae bacterium]
MQSSDFYNDGFGRLAQVGGGGRVRLVRLTGLDGGNRYTARAIEYGADGALQYVTSEEQVVTNLAEPADTDGRLSADTDAVAIDVEGRWIVHLSLAGTAMFPARVLSSGGGGAMYTVRPQTWDSGGELIDRGGSVDLTATNLAELSLGPGGAVDPDTIVLVAPLHDEADPPTIRYVFSHPAYAKYLD